MSGLNLIRWIGAVAFAMNAACLPALPPPVISWVIAGQSNAYGASTQATPDSSAFAFSYGHDEVWRRAADPTIHFPGATASSAWPQFIFDEWNRTGSTLRLIATARGGRCLVLGAAEWDPASGWAYADMVRYVTDTGVVPRAVLWHQGECDAQKAIKLGLTYQQAFDTYYTALIGLGEAVASDLGIQVIAAPVSLVECRWTNPSVSPPTDLICDTPDPIFVKRLPIHDATLQAILDRPDLFCLGPDSDDLLHEPDAAHVHDVIALGQRWSLAVLDCGR